MTQVHKNEMHLAGVLAKAPAVRFTRSGKKVAALTVATTWKQATEYHKVVCWELIADKAEPLAKGDFVQIVGRLQTRSWEDASKVKHYGTEVVAWQLVIPGKQQVTVSTTGAEITDSDIPF
jgi:single-strand DNA-binding protein